MSVWFSIHAVSALGALAMAWRYHKIYFFFLFAPLFFLGTLILYFFLLYLVSLCVNMDVPQKKDSRFFRFLMNQTCVLILKLGRVHIHCSGLERLRGLPPFLLAANHRSDFDSFVALAACPGAKLAYICKPEIFRIPITGRLVYKCLFLPIDRSSAREALVTVNRAASLLREGTVSIAVFPEGTRNHGDGLLPFRSGCFQIAKRAGAPLVIARTRGTENIARNFFRRRTDVSFEILDVIPAGELAVLSTRAISQRAADTINDTGKENP